VYLPVFDPLYFVFALPALLLAFYAQWKVRSAYSKYLRVPNWRGISGLEAAQRLLAQTGLRLNIEGTPGELTDHYDPRTKTLRLSSAVANGRSVASVAIVAHEIGHALQDAQAYAPLKLRGGLVPALTVSAWVAPILFFIGWLAGNDSLAWLGIAGFGLATLFALITLPVELNASSRALSLLRSYQLVDGRELGGAKAVLDAAALTYVAALAQTLSTLLYYIFLLTGARRRD
jgi:Zn-dependent membrane protease YugP